MTVPVRLVSATKSLDVRFHQLEAGTGARVRMRRVSEATGDEVPYDQIVKGYELEAGRYVVIEPEELDTLKPKASRAIEIEDFVDLAGIDPVYFEQPYYLIPGADAAKPYRLLVDVMEEEQKVAIGRIVMRSKESLVAIRPLDGVLCLETMRYHDEVLAADRDGALPEADTEPSERELDMARQLVAALTGTFDPEKYRDEYREELLALIDKKAAGEEIVQHEVPEEPGKVLDLMAALEASLARSGARQAAKAKTGPDDDEEELPPAAKTSAPAAKAAPKKKVVKKAPAKTAAAKKAAKKVVKKPAAKAEPAKRARKTA
ncbi:MAG: Ku protein [Acidimicrobiia bacterium]